MGFLEELKQNGVCMICKHCNHDFPSDVWHEEKHLGGWHSCDIYGGFRFSKPGCERIEVMEDDIHEFSCT